MSMQWEKCDYCNRFIGAHGCHHTFIEQNNSIAWYCDNVCQNDWMNQQNIAANIIQRAWLGHKTFIQLICRNDEETKEAFSSTIFNPYSKNYIKKKKNLKDSFFQIRQKIYNL